MSLLTLSSFQSSSKFTYFYISRPKAVLDITHAQKPFVGRKGVCETSSAQSNLSPSPPSVSRAELRAVNKTANREAYQALITLKKSRSAKRPADNRGTGKRRRAAGRPIPGALTTHRALSWSPGRRSTASAASSPASQAGMGWRPPNPASFRPKVATSTGTLNSPSLRIHQLARRNFREPP